MSKRQSTFWRIETTRVDADQWPAETYEAKTKKEAEKLVWDMVRGGQCDFAHITKMRSLGEDTESGIEWIETFQLEEPYRIGKAPILKWQTMGWINGEPNDDDFLTFRSSSAAQIYATKRLKGETFLPNHHNELAWGQFDDTDANEVSVEVFRKDVGKEDWVKIEDVTYSLSAETGEAEINDAPIRVVPPFDSAIALDEDRAESDATISNPWECFSKPWEGDDLRRSWGGAARERLLGATILGVRYMTEQETEESGFHRSPIILLLSDREGKTFHLYPMADDEGNDGGAMGTSWEDHLNTIPVI